MYDVMETMRKVFLETVSRTRLSLLLKVSNCILHVIYPQWLAQGLVSTAFQLNECTNEEPVGDTAVNQTGEVFGVLKVKGRLKLNPSRKRI